MTGLKMNEFNVGGFDRKVSWQTVTTTKTGMGSPAKSYSHSFYQMMSRVMLPQSGEAMVNSRQVLGYRFMYRGHYRSAMNEEMAIVDDNIKYNVLSINPVNNRMFVEVIVERITE